MQATTLLSVMSSAVVAAALSSTAVQLQPTSVLVAAAPAAQVAVAPAVRPPDPEVVVAAPARPAYVQVASTSAAVVLAAEAEVAHAQPPTVDVIACSTAWSTTGECLGTQAAVLRDVAVTGVEQALPVPAGVPHLRVSVHGGQVEVDVAP